jgi:gamma-polyglutamate biosynthesis protein CapA
MMHASTFIAFVAIPLYVLGSFTSSFWVRGLTPTPEPSPIIISIVGDMMFDRYIRERGDAMGYDMLLAGTLPLFASSTHVFGNLEGPITTFASVSDYRDPGPNHYRFTFATTVASVLADSGFKAVTLANNHILNFGNEGLMQTKQWLEAVGVGYTGSPDEAYVPWRSDENGIPIAVFGYDDWISNDTEELAARIAEEGEGVFIVVLAHWGREYEAVPTNAQRSIAKAFVDAGADLVVGSHPHVIQNKELYNDAWIYYSLGNFVFDQYFNPSVRCGAVLTITVQPDLTYTAEEAFTELARNGATVLSDCATEVPELQ